MKWWQRGLALALVPTLAIAPAALGVSDQDLTGTTYRVTESQVGGAGDFNASGTTYKLSPSKDDGGSTLGEAAVGNSAGTTYQSGAGFNTTAQPGLTFVVNTTSVDFGTLTSAGPVYRNATFDVTNYTSYGYVVQVVGTPPTYSGNSLNALSTDTASSAGTEQFGMNIVNNPSAVVGANPAVVGTGTNSQGVAGDGTTGAFGSTRPYTVPDKFRYVSGETIASAPKSSGATRFTMTLLANISTVNTPITRGSGGYTGNLTLIATGTY